MTPLKQLDQQFPRVFCGKVPAYSDVEPGWAGIAQALFQRLDQLLAEQGCAVDVRQVKEQWGELRVDRGDVLTLCDVHAAERTNTLGPDV